MIGDIRALTLSSRHRAVGRERCDQFVADVRDFSAKLNPHVIDCVAVFVCPAIVAAACFKNGPARRKVRDNDTNAIEMHVAFLKVAGSQI